MEDGPRRVGDVVIEVSHPISAGVNEFAVADHAQGATGRVGAVKSFKHPVNLSRLRFGRLNEAAG
jgi:hypothetical protein